MNYYERIQRSMDYIENKLEEDIKVEDAAKEAYMSVSNFHRMFFAIVGYPVKEYIRRRRVSQAAKDIKNGNEKIVEIAMKYAYDSSDSFSRTFKNITGILPSKYTGAQKDFLFERIDVMDKYFEEQEPYMLELYPDIKILKEMEPFRVACSRYYGRNPENGAFAIMSDWLKRNNIILDEGNYRIFGYNTPDSQEGAEEYGYEVCVTIPDSLQVDDEQIVVKMLEGGLYAVTSIERSEDIGENIVKGWKRFQQWLSGSKYVYGGRQWMEEHLGFTSQGEHIGGIDLYMPIMPKSELDVEETEEIINPMTIVSYTAKGKNAERTARKIIFEWAKKNKIDFSAESTRLFAYYNFENIGKPDFAYTLNLSVAEDTVVNDEKIEKSVHPGGLYLKRIVPYRINGNSWFDFIGSMNNHRIYSFGNHWFMEEYLISEPDINDDTAIAQHMPVARK